MSQVITGATVKLKINGKIVASASNVSYSLNYETIPISGIDQIEIDELAEVSMSVDFSCSMFRIYQKGAISLGIMPKLSNILKRDELVAVIEYYQNKVTPNTIDANGYATSYRGEMQDAKRTITVGGIKCKGMSGSVDARGAWVETLTFSGRVLYDESGS